jgi:hypothetical protein
MYAKNWIVPRWGNLPLEQLKTVEVERWLRATGVADGTKAKIKCVMSALFSHAATASLCFDLGHARQVDPTMTEANCTNISESSCAVLPFCFRLSMFSTRSWSPNTLHRFGSCMASG